MQKGFSLRGQLSAIAYDVVNITESKTQGQGNAYLDAVSQLLKFPGCEAANIVLLNSGLDNAGKTTIVKRLMNEDVTSISPTLGFIIKTIDFQGLHHHF